MASTGGGPVLGLTAGRMLMPVAMVAASMAVDVWAEGRAAAEIEEGFHTLSITGVAAGVLAVLLEGLKLNPFSALAATVTVFLAALVAGQRMGLSPHMAALALVVLFSLSLGVEQALFVSLRGAASTLCCVCLLGDLYWAELVSAPMYLWLVLALAIALALFGSRGRREPPLSSLRAVLDAGCAVAVLFLGLGPLAIPASFAAQLPVDSPLWGVGKMVARTALLFQLGMMIRSFAEKRAVVKGHKGA